MGVLLGRLHLPLQLQLLNGILVLVLVLKLVLTLLLISHFIVLFFLLFLLFLDDAALATFLLFYFIDLIDNFLCRSRCPWSLGLDFLRLFFLLIELGLFVSGFLLGFLLALRKNPLQLPLLDELITFNFALLLNFEDESCR